MPTAQISQVLELFSFTTIALLSLLAYRILSQRYPTIKRIAESRQVFTLGLIIGIYFFVYAFFSLYSTLGTDLLEQHVPIISLRTVSPTDSGHFIALLVVFVFGFIVWLHPKPNLVRMGILVLGLLGYHELLWNLAYLPTCVPSSPAYANLAFYFPCSWQEFAANSFMNSYVQATLTFSLYLLAGLLFYPKEFKRSVRYLPFWVGFMALWVIAGFHITIDSRLNPAWASPFFNNPDVDLVENLSWFIFASSFVYAYLEVHPLSENWLYQSLKSFRKYSYKGTFRTTSEQNGSQEGNKDGTDGGRNRPISGYRHNGDTERDALKPQVGRSNDEGASTRQG